MLRGVSRAELLPDSKSRGSVMLFHLQALLPLPTQSRVFQTAHQNCSLQVGTNVVPRGHFSRQVT